jgi:PKD repeat protein
MKIRNLLLWIILSFFIITAIQIGCDDLVTEQIFITESGHPTAEFEIDTGSVDVGCAPLSVRFIDLSDGPRDQWLWKFGDGDSSMDTTPVHIYTDPGFYTVTLKITDSESGGTDTEVKTRFIYVGTTDAEFVTSVDSGCAGLEVTFTPSLFGPTRSYDWDFGDGNSATDSIVTHTFDTAGVFDVSLTVTDSCGTLSTSNQIITTVCPNVSFALTDTTVCTPLEVSFIDLSSGPEPSYIMFPDSSDWWFGDGTSSMNNSNPTHTYTSAGSYTVKLRVVGEGGTSIDSLIEFVNVFDATTADFTVIGDTIACKNDFVQHQVKFINQTTGDIDSVIWDFDDGTFVVTSDTEVVHAYITPGIYSVTMTAYGSCGEASTFRQNMVTLYDSLATIDADFITQYGIDIADTIFVDSVMTFIGQSNNELISDWMWNFGDGTNGSAKIINHAYTVVGTYEVKLTVSNLCNSVEMIDTVYVIELN